MYEYGRRPFYKKKKKQRYYNCSEYLSQHLPIAIPEPPRCYGDCTNLGCVSLGGRLAAAAIGAFLSSWVALFSTGPAIASTSPRLTPVGVAPFGLHWKNP
jgi:hypothetical protein